MTCANCRYWTPHDDYYGSFGLCRKIVHNADVLAEIAKRLGLDIYDDKVNQYWLHEMKNRLAHVIDTSDYHAELKTKAEFNCCLYEAKGE